MTQTATLEEVEQRLRGLPESLVVDPEDARAITRIAELRIPIKQAAKTQRAVPLLRLGAVGMAVAVVILLNVVAAYYAPTYSRAVADAPGIGGPSSKVLAAFGLSAADVTSINDTASSAGHTLHLAAGYADGLRTVLYVSIDGRGLDGNPKEFGMNAGDYGLGEFTLTDQFGRSYAPNGVGGPTMIQFTPLAWPASRVGARLTLHVTSIQAMWLRGAGEVQGDWTLHATLVAEPAHTLVLPSPVHTPQANYTFTSIRSSATTLIIRWTVDGPAVDRINVLWKDARIKTLPQVPQGPPNAEQQQLERDYFWPQVFDTSGRQVLLSEWGFTFAKRATGELTAYIPGPGRYRIQLGGTLTADALQRWIVVP